MPAPPSRVLIVEDDPFIGMIESRLLRSLGAEATVCPTMAEGLAEAAAGGWTLVLLDLNLPDGHGEALLDAFLRMPTLRCVPVLCVSGDDGADGWVRRAGAGGAHRPGLGLLRKPFNKASFQERLRDELHRADDAICA